MLLGDLYLFAVLDSARNFYSSRDLPLQFLFFFSFSPRIVVRPVPAKNTPDFQVKVCIYMCVYVCVVTEIRRLKLSLMREKEREGIKGSLINFRRYFWIKVYSFGRELSGSGIINFPG